MKQKMIFLREYDDYTVMLWKLRLKLIDMVQRKVTNTECWRIKARLFLDSKEKFIENIIIICKRWLERKKSYHNSINLL